MSILNSDQTLTRPDLDIVLVGHVCIDENSSNDSRQARSWGSAVLYADQYLRKSTRTRRRIIASYGVDFCGEWPEIDIANPPTGCTTLVYKNQTTGNETIRRCSNWENSAEVAITDGLELLIGGADLVIVAPLLPNYSAAYLVGMKARAKETSKWVLIAQGYLRAVGQNGLITPRRFVESEQILPLFEIVVIADEDISQSWRIARKTATLWSTTHPRLNVVVTRGALGAVLFRGGSESRFDASPIGSELLENKVGAGDTFAAAMALNFSITNDVEGAVHAGNDEAHKFLTEPTGHRVVSAN
jgi:hypothetical protein